MEETKKRTNRKYEDKDIPVESYDMLRLTYEDMDSHPEVWLGDRGLEYPSWAEDIAMLGYKGVSAMDFYEDVFREDLEPNRQLGDYRTREYGAIALELFDEIIKRDGKAKRKVHRYTITDELQSLFHLIGDSEHNEHFILIAPVAYAGKERTNKNARLLYALCVEIDDINPKNGINEMFYTFERVNRPVPRPTYVVCSGNGLHLYYVFERAIPLFKNIFTQFTEVKRYITKQLWSAQITTSYHKIQFQSICQAYRAVGTTGKNKNKRALAFKTGDKLTIEDFNARIPKKYAINKIYKSELTKAEAQKLYPEWYQRIVVEKGERKHWNRHDGIYYNWIAKCYEMAEVNHRYFCLENLCSLAVQCEIPPEQVEKDVRELAEFMESLTCSEDNHFTEYDIVCAMTTYNEPTNVAYNRKIEFISDNTGIPLNRNSRKGRKQSVHLAKSRASRDSIMEELGRDWRDGNGRKPKGDVVHQWRASHPEGKKADCIRETGLSKPTVYKWWNETE